MAKYRKKPIEIEAVQWFEMGDHHHVQRWLSAIPHSPCSECGKPMGGHGKIYSLKKLPQKVCPGDWIITEAKGERYPCKPDAFEATYEPVD